MSGIEKMVQRRSNLRRPELAENTELLLPTNESSSDSMLSNSNGGSATKVSGTEAIKAKLLCHRAVMALDFYACVTKL